MGNCYFCEEASDFTKAKSRLPIDWPFEDEVVYCDENVYSIVGSGPQVSPYLLILPKRHIYSLAEMNSNEWHSFLCCLEYITNKGGYGEELCIFEHGGMARESSASIDHCHVHVIRGEIGLYKQESFDQFIELKEFTCNNQITGSKYLLIGRYQNKKLDIKINYNNTECEHQYFRKMLAKQLCIQEWDWKKDPKYDLMIETLISFKKKIK